MKTTLLIAISVQNPFDNATPISGFHCTLNMRNRIDQIFKIEVYLHIGHDSMQHGLLLLLNISQVMLGGKLVTGRVE